MCSGVYFENDVLVFPNGYAMRNSFENDVLVFPNGYAMRNKLRQNLVDKPDKSDILNI